MESATTNDTFVAGAQHCYNICEGVACGTACDLVLTFAVGVDVLRRSCIEIGRECGLEYSYVVSRVSRVVYAARQLQQPLHVVTLQA